MSDYKIVKWIMETNLKRWLLFLPISFVSAFLVGFIWEIINRISMGRLISTESFLYNMYNMPISGLITGFIFIYVGGYIAPHKVVSIFLLGLIIIVCVLLLFGNIFMFEKTDYWICLYSIFIIIGSFIARNYLKNERKEQ